MCGNRGRRDASRNCRRGRGGADQLQERAAHQRSERCDRPNDPQGVSPDALVNGATLIHEHLGNNVDLMVEELRGAAAEGSGAW